MKELPLFSIPQQPLFLCFRLLIKWQDNTQNAFKISLKRFVSTIQGWLELWVFCKYFFELIFCLCEPFKRRAPSNLFALCAQHVESSVYSTNASRPYNSIYNRLFCDLERGTEESAAHSDGLGNNRKSGVSPPWARLYLLANLSNFRFIWTFQEWHDACLNR